MFVVNVELMIEAEKNREEVTCKRKDTKKKKDPFDS